ncbi:MAG: BrxA family protein, partial [Lachnoanaerobaculum gingivalis]
MDRKEYSAGAVKLSFWFMEFRKVVSLLAAGKNLEEIKEINKKENIFGAPTTLRSEQIFNT